jgi:AbrB family looped-hinge helix DNA binding protein
MESREEQGSMALVRVKRAGQVTLPADLRKQFHLEEGDYLEAEAVEHGILFRPVSVVDRPQDQSPRAPQEEITHAIKEPCQDDVAARRA